MNGQKPTISGAMPHADHQRIADRLAEAGDLLEQQGANSFRVAAYRRAAVTVRTLGADLETRFADDGIAGLTRLPGIGDTLARAIAEMLHTGRWAQLDRLRGTGDPEQLFRSIAGICPELAEQIHHDLGIDSLNDLEMVCRDGRLQSLPGIGERRTAMLRAALGERLSRTRQWSAVSSEGNEPDVAMLLDVDREYRDKARRGRLQLIAPRRFNPKGAAWLPILHTEREEWHVTVMFSNTARAHDLKRTRDWVVIFFQGDSEPEGQRTIVTETQGPLAGKRVVRGRESACRTYYEAQSAGAVSTSKH